MKPSYHKRDIAGSLNLSTFAVMFLMQGFFAIMQAKRESDEVQALLTQYFHDFTQRVQEGV